MTDKKTIALKYAEIGLSIIPIKNKGKKPLINWLEYQTRKATLTDIEEWWNKWPEANIGIITGTVSRIIVLDIDREDDFPKEINLPPTLSVKTSKGRHLYFRIPENKTIPTAVLKWGELQADKRYVVAPPSIHSSGVTYEWEMLELENLKDISVFPMELLEQLGVSKDGEDKLYKKIEAGEKISLGERHSVMTSYIGKILSNIPYKDWETIGWDIIINYNKTNFSPPLPEKEILEIFNGIAKKELNNNQEEKEDKNRETKANKALNFLLNEKDIVLFKDDRGESYIRFKVENHYEIYPLNNSNVKAWIQHEYYLKFKNTLGTDGFNNIKDILDGKAQFEGRQYKLKNRFSYKDQVLWYDLVNTDWESVQITSDGWKIIKDTPIIFKRYSHQKQQYKPVPGGNIKEILSFVNIQDKDQEILFLVLLISSFIPGFPHPMPYFYGTMGSAKSSISKIMRAIIDPSLLEVSEFPTNEEKLIHLFDKNEILFFDNVSYLSNKQSDMLCKVITGSSYSKRKLYTDNEDVIIEYKKIVGMNGISLQAKKSDLLERSILFPLKRMPDKKRRVENELMKDFYAKLPYFLGSIFDTLSKAMNVKDSIEIDKLPRMADFTIWGSAIAVALEYNQNDFLHAYTKNINSQNMEVIYEDPTAIAIIDFMSDKKIWSGTSSELLSEIKTKVDFEEDKFLPKNGSSLGRKIEEIKLNLESIGITFWKERESTTRKIFIENKKLYDTNDTKNIIGKKNTENKFNW